MLDKTRKPLFSNLEKNIFLKDFEGFFSFGKCRIVPKNIKGALGFLTYILLQNIKKNSKGGTSWDIKKFRKKSHSAQNKSKGTL